MIKIQNNSQINREHFKSSFSYFVIESIIEGNSCAEVYVDQLQKPNITVAWDTKHNLNCGGNADKELIRNAVKFIKDDILISEVRQKSGIIKIMYENNEWREALLEGIKDMEYKIYPRSIYKHSLKQIPSFQCKDKDIVIKRIDSEMMNNHNLKNMEGVVDEIVQMWGTIENFLTKGFGFCALKDNCIAAWCTSEYMSKTWCGIGIETFEEYQGKGIAAAAAIELISHCKEFGKTPHWDCWQRNIPSVKTAEKAGFEKLADYDIIFLKLI